MISKIQLIKKINHYFCIITKQEKSSNLKTNITWTNKSRTFIRNIFSRIFFLFLDYLFAKLKVEHPVYTHIKM